MKSEHRHELKTNDLAKSLITFGDYVRVYGGRVALGIAIIILVIVLIIQRVNRSREAQAVLPGKLDRARSVIDRLQNAALFRDVNQRLAPMDKEVTEDARAAIQEVKENASDKALKAEALVTEGDLNWAIATYVAPPSDATTKPVPVTDTQRRDAATAARSAYEAVLSQFSDQPLAAASARFGLGALAENARDWAAARQQYEAVKSIPNVSRSFQQLAEKHLAALEPMQRPLIVGTVPGPVLTSEDFEVPFKISPTSAPATTKSATAPK